MEIFFSILRDYKAAFHSDRTILHTTAMFKGSNCFISSPTLLLSIFLIIAILVGVKWNLIVDLVFVSLIANDVQYFLYVYYWSFV